MKKLALLIAVILLISAFFVANQPITPKLALVSSISVLFFALPSYFAVIKLLGKKQGIALLILIGFYALFIESLAIKTGVPYGHFIYKDVLGNKLFGLTPWTVAFAYPPIVIASYFIARQLKKSTPIVLTATALLCTVTDLVLDPAAVKLGFWYWYGGGFFYNVPLVNFLGWIVTSFIGASIVHYFLQNKQLPRTLLYSGFLIIWFWVWVNMFLGQAIPSVIGTALLLSYISYSRRHTGILPT